MKSISNYSLYNFILGGVWLVICAGCKKQELSNTRIVTGTVKNKINNLPLQGVSVLLENCVFEGVLLYGTTTCSGLKTAITDANGKYEISYDAEMKKSYKVGIPYEYTYGTNPIKLINNSVNIVDFTVSRIVTLKIKYKNFRHDRNYIQISVNGGVYGNYLNFELYNGINPTYDIDTVFFRKIPADENYILQTTLFTYPNKPTPPDHIFNTYNFYAPDQDTISINHVVL